MKPLLNRYSIIALVAAFALVPTAAGAVSLKAGESLKLLHTDQIDGNAYIASGESSIETTFPNDLILLSGESTLEGQVQQDATILGGSTVVASDVGGDLRIIAAESSITGAVAGDLFAMSGQLLLGSGMVVRGHTTIYAERVVIEGTIMGPLTVHARTIEVRGTLLGESTFSVGESLMFADTAVIHAPVHYGSPTQAMVSSNATISADLEYRNTPTDTPRSGSMRAIMSAFSIAHLISFIFAAAFLSWLFPAFTTRATRYVLAESGKSFAIGAATVVVAPVLALALISTLLGALLGVVLGIGGIVYLILAKVVSAFIAGALLSQWFIKHPSSRPVWVALGAASLWVIGFVPILGLLANVLIFFAAAGSLTMGMYELWWKDRKRAILSTHG